jgi:hypothetical protein
MKDVDAPNELRICFIAFVDILGYRDRIQKCNNDYDALNRELQDFKLKILESQSLLTRSIEALRGTVSFFSDSVYVHVPIASASPKSFDDGRAHICLPIEDLGMYQFNLAMENIFIRGGATVNFGYMDKSIIFGPGILNAVDCEKDAEYPRICLTKWAMEPISCYIKNKWPGDERINKFILCGEDGKYFINYLQTVVDYIEQTCDSIPDEAKEYPLYRNIPDAIDLIKKHKENIEINLKESKDPSVKSKFVWVANYHNYFCTMHFNELRELIIPEYREEFSTFLQKNEG